MKHLSINGACCARFFRRAAVVLTACFVLTGCGAADNGAAADTKEQPAAVEEKKEEPAAAETDTQKAEETASQNTEPASVQELYQLVRDQLPDMYEADDDFLMNYYGIDASLLKEYVFASCEDAARVDSVILLRVKDEKDAPAVIESLNGLIAQMEAEMDNYNPEAHELVKAAAVRQHGDLIDLVISADREKLISLLDSRIG